MPFELYYNERAGRASKLYPQVLALMEAYTNDVRRVPEWSQYGDTYIVLGGDGTFNTLLNSLPQPEKFRYILLSGGTSNSLYSQLSPDEEPLAKLRRAFTNPTFQELDLPELTIDGKTYHFINEASAGFAAAIAHEVEQRQTKRFFNRLKLSELAYIATAFRCWRKDEPYFLSLCNNRRISGDLYPCVNANPSDGKIDVYELHCPRWRLPFKLMKLVKAKTDKVSKFVSRKQVTNAEWHFDTPLPVEIDGNPLSPTQNIRLGLYPKKIQVF